MKTSARHGNGAAANRLCNMPPLWRCDPAGDIASGCFPVVETTCPRIGSRCNAVVPPIQNRWRIPSITPSCSAPASTVPPADTGVLP